MALPGSVVFMAMLLALAVSQHVAANPQVDLSNPPFSLPIPSNFNGHVNAWFNQLRPNVRSILIVAFHQLPKGSAAAIAIELATSSIKPQDQDMVFLVNTINGLPIEMRKSIVGTLLNFAGQPGGTASLNPLLDLSQDQLHDLLDCISVRPVGAVLVPGLHNAIDLTFPGADVIFSTDKYIPDKGMENKKPQWFCKYLNYAAIDVEDMFTVNEGFRNGLSEVIKNYTVSFHHGGFAVDTYVNFFLDNTNDIWEDTLVPLFHDHKVNVGRFYGFKAAAGGLYWMTYNSKRQPLPQLCVRRTFMKKSTECSSISTNVIENKWSNVLVLFRDAQSMCQRTLGLDLPTGQLLAAALMDPKCSDYLRDWSDSWVQSHKYTDANNGIATKKFLCMGCRVQLVESDGVASVDFYGNLKCKGGYVLDLPNPRVRPLCVKGYWLMASVGRCRSVWIAVNRNIMYLPVRASNMAFPTANLTRDVHGFSANPDAASRCESGSDNFLRPAAYTAIGEYNFAAIRRMMASWGERSTAWIGGGYFATISNFASLGPFGTHARGLFCKATCYPDVTGMYHLEWTNGQVTCNRGWIWECPAGHVCPREGQPPVYPICNSNWVNIARCTRANGPVWVDTSDERSVDSATATVTCKHDTYESCNHQQCAGGPDNEPVLYNGNRPTNLPDCHKFQLFQVASVQYARSTTQETKETAKSACERNGYYLLSELHFYYTSLADHRNELANSKIFDGQLWVMNAKGDINIMDQQVSSAKNHFVCVLYKAVATSPFAYLDWARSPEQCISGYNTTITYNTTVINGNGFHPCAKATAA